MLLRTLKSSFETNIEWTRSMQGFPSRGKVPREAGYIAGPVWEHLSVLLIMLSLWVSAHRRKILPSYSTPAAISLGLNVSHASKTCYKQKEPRLNPSKSSSYKNISCSSAVCDLVASEGTKTCSSSACLYQVQYGDGSYSIGITATETLTLSATDVFKNFLFGCGQQNQGLFGGAAGLLGLGRTKLAFPSQTAKTYRKLFSYCLPASSSSNGYLSFGGKSLQVCEIHSFVCRLRLDAFLRAGYNRT
ncbi:hypothetical protein OIU84_000096 [Salix udensis]|uniref:Xylanase inhibitor N-terminal domain-containing protein n=1 Tax=Salix udensis TaxID=889485 RepID=A0AAD6L537_9ROSI|nr:hypothetical protein OIU84_000096 [Salix udensis]